jgi:hypothetical protein
LNAVSFDEVSKGAAMLKAITHFEQVPLGLVMKIIERDQQAEIPEESFAKNKQNLSTVPAAAITRTGGEND